jgi:hypothetical protein
MTTGKILTPQDEAIAQATEFSLMVNVNGQQMPLALAKLLVANETAENLKRIADVLERLETVLGNSKPPKLESV